MFALITYEYRYSEQALAHATFAFGIIDEQGADMGLHFQTGNDGQMDFLRALKIYYDGTERMFTVGREDMKDIYDALMDLIDRLGKHADQKIKPSQTTIYHKHASEKAKADIHLSESREKNS